MSDPFESLTAADRQALRQAAQPEWAAPMLATLTHEAFSDPDWLFERKLDGERALAFRLGERVRLLSRNRKELNAAYPELIEALAAQPGQDFVVDGEVVAFDGDRTSFSRLQRRLQIRDPDKARASGVAVYYYLFDVMHLEGRRLDGLRLRARKALLKQAIRFEDPVRFTSHRNEAGQAFLEEACRKGWEGLIAKRAASSYRHSRSRDWLKLKCSQGQELVIGGFTAPKGERIGFGALLVGYYEGGELRYAGKVGTGFDDRLLAELRERLEGLARKTSPFAGEVREKDVTWVSPKLVGEIGFTEWTQDDKLRHPRFLGLRRDKEPREVLREA